MRIKDLTRTFCNATLTLKRVDFLSRDSQWLSFRPKTKLSYERVSTSDSLPEWGTCTHGIYLDKNSISAYRILSRTAKALIHLSTPGQRDIDQLTIQQIKQAAGVKLGEMT